MIYVRKSPEVTQRKGKLHTHTKRETQTHTHAALSQMYCVLISHYTRYIISGLLFSLFDKLKDYCEIIMV